LKRLVSASASTSRATLSYPPGENQAAPVTGPPGTECALILARRSGPIDLGDVQDLWDGRLPWPALPDASVLRLRRDGVRVEQAGRDLGAPIRRSDPEAGVRGRLEQFAVRLQGRFDYFEAVAFCHVN
jgi:hypothetical protein